MKQDSDLFGNNITIKPKRKSKLESSFIEFEKTNFNERLKRLEFINKFGPKNYSLMGDMEFVFTYNEIEKCYIYGNFIATLILSQSFIEKLFASYLVSKGFEKETKYGLEKMLKCIIKKKLIHPKICEMVDKLRLKRNPFVHSKDWEYPHLLSKRTFENKKLPEEQLENDAKEAMQILFAVFTIKLVG